MLRSALIALALTMFLGTAPAHAGTIVFDFEDGLQGWELTGAVQRVQTQLLGGEWAIFGDGFLGATLSTRVDLTDIVSISLETVLVDGNQRGLVALVFGGQVGDFITFEVVEPGNPNLVAIDVGSFAGLGSVQIWWAFPFIITGGRAVAFIDNVTFHTIPEPSVLGMLVVGAAMAGVRRRCVTAVTTRLPRR